MSYCAPRPVVLGFVLRLVPAPSPIGRSAAPAAFAMLDPLRAVLAPRPGERMLEVGAGNGVYTFAIAAELRPGGSLDILDAHPERLAATMLGAGERGLQNISPTLGDARYLPFEDRTFDGAYLVAALGDAADAVTTLGELRRVLRHGARLVVGELNGDPHRVAPEELARCARGAGLRVGRRVDGLLGYVARLEPQDA
jgi:ubiquinone/menaquinone biosynthesis C-methylase UbiE